MASAASNKIKQLLLKGDIDFDSDSFIIILMKPSFSFDIDSHENYSDVSASEVDTAFGYTQGTKSVTIDGSVVMDTANDRGYVNFNNVTWTATGTIVALGAIIYDDTVANDPIVGYIDFASNQTVLNGGTFTISNMQVELT